MRPKRRHHVPTGLYAGTRLVSSTGAFWRALSRLESFSIENSLNEVSIEKPVFICGLARSGSTILTEVISQHPSVTSHHYSDFPLIWLPYWWNRLRQRLPLPKQTPKERAHADRIMVTNDSPEAVEEVLWSTFFPAAHKIANSHVLDKTDRNANFDEHYRQHIRKLLLARDGSRYLAKNNYLVTRLTYLLSLFPDARVVIPVRQPLSHVGSSCKQHKLFCQMASEDPRVTQQLQMSAHFEFGPGRCPIIISEEKRSIYKNDLNDVAWYAHQWNDVYGHITEQIRTNPNLTKACLVLPYEDLCDNTEASLRELFEHIELADRDSEALIQARRHEIEAPTHNYSKFSKAELTTINAITQATQKQIAELH